MYAQAHARAFIFHIPMDRRNNDFFAASMKNCDAVLVPFEQFTRETTRDGSAERSSDVSARYSERYLIGYITWLTWTRARTYIHTCASLLWKLDWLCPFLSRSLSSVRRRERTDEESTTDEGMQTRNAYVCKYIRRAKTWRTRYPYLSFVFFVLPSYATVSFPLLFLVIKISVFLPFLLVRRCARSTDI